MVANLRMQGLKEDLMRTAVDLDTLSQALDGHTRYLRHSANACEAMAMHMHVDGLRASAEALRGAAQNIDL